MILPNLGATEPNLHVSTQGWTTFVLFKTPSSLNTRQVIWRLGYYKSGMALYLDNDRLYASAGGPKVSGVRDNGMGAD